VKPQKHLEYEGEATDTYRKWRWSHRNI